MERGRGGTPLVLAYTPPDVKSWIKHWSQLITQRVVSLLLTVCDIKLVTISLFPIWAIALFHVIVQQVVLFYCFVTYVSHL